jgi:hypothetical protein
MLTELEQKNLTIKSNADFSPQAAPLPHQHIAYHAALGTGLGTTRPEGHCCSPGHFTLLSCLSF